MEKIKEIIATVKEHWKLFGAAACIGFIVGAAVIGPLAAGIQYLVDKF